jgi:hypothetical protein
MTLDLSTTGLLYGFLDTANSKLDSSGTIVTSRISATPLSASWTFLLIGLAGAFLAYRRKNKMPLVAA